MTDAGEALAAAARVLAAAGVESARADAELLLAHELGESRGRVQALALTGGDVDRDALARFARLVERRADREPLQHLTGRAAFRTVELAVGPGVFVPRPETEVVAQLAIDAARGMEAPVVVDLATGSGAIALAVAAEVPAAAVTGVERNAAALAWAQRNAADLALPNARIAQGDLADALPELDGGVDVVVSNPPYIPDGMIPRDPEVRLHDPADALFGGPDGLDPMRAVVATAVRLLRAGGLLVVEHGEHQGEAVRALLDPAVWGAPATHPDLTGRDRATTARRR
ncbi:peptide chain release factor N(5)-glutamine methyltransferase [Amnibacterium sp. CER49]|uniref:peptide chain release factor N(5)-glutamine methyltransferase n=1 Tax=Amnibacterium sp. CER49 TaxID=3039161 RepID=UPI00244D2180|nr:peptide chain release factor N(5)-glutamine methyltransferase [Amnibacterium sp. CER49]MDH2445100.1 peptide chain release factor N(5)-glutamine methyltransferase [Amnibacterium sp. CER49]